MAIAKITKVQIIAHLGLKMEILSALQEEGLVHIEETNFEELGLSSSTPDVAELDHRLYKLAHAIYFLSQWEVRSFAEKLSGQKPTLQIAEREKALDFDHLSFVERVEKLEADQNELLSDIKFLEKELEFLYPLESFRLSIRSVASTRSTDIRLGILPSSRLPEMKVLAEKEPVFMSVIKMSKRNAHVFLVIHKRETEQLEQNLREMLFTPLYFTEPILNEADDEDKVSDVILKIQSEMRQKEKQLEDMKTEGRHLAEHREELMLVFDVLSNERKKMTSTRMLGETEKVFYLKGWIQTSDIKKLEAKLKPYSEYVEYFFKDPDPDEDFPVVLKNRSAWKPFEIITKLYGLPKRGSFDPTLPLAPFFFLFVGIAVSEAGYGALVALLSLLFIKFAKPKGGLLQFLRLLSILGVSTVILGTLLGGWFGFPVRKLMILDPLQDPVKFLILALALGFIQVWFGTLLNMLSELRNKQYGQAIFVQGGWMVLLPSLVLYAVTKQAGWVWPALAGASGIVLFSSPSRNLLARFFGGLYGLYNISGYLSDVLSYSRLLALGLATSVIAMVVNTLCQTALGIPWVGWLIAALIFVVGHLFNLGISFLGGFVHSMRLQFVEFFSKFFKSGGKPFKAFALESKYIDFVQ